MKVIQELENIDDECDQHEISFVKIDDKNEASKYGLKSLPKLVLFEKGIPNIYDGKIVDDYNFFSIN